MFAFKNTITLFSPRPQGHYSFMHKNRMNKHTIFTKSLFKSHYTTITVKNDWNTITNFLRTKTIPNFEKFLDEVKNSGNNDNENTVTELVRYSKIIQNITNQSFYDIESAKSSRKIQKDFIEEASSWYLYANEVKIIISKESFSIDVMDSIENISICIDKFNQDVFNFTNSHLYK